MILDVIHPTALKYNIKTITVLLVIHAIRFIPAGLSKALLVESFLAWDIT